MRSGVGSTDCGGWGAQARAWIWLGSGRVILPGARLLLFDVSACSTTGVPVMPDGLTGTEEAAWCEIVALLEPRGVLTPCDAPMVELTARTLATMRQADAVIGREGSTMRTASGYLQQRPEVAISHKSRLLLKLLLGELGMSPASRSNVDVPPPAVEGSAFQKFLERGRRLDERRQQHKERDT